MSYQEKRTVMGLITGIAFIIIYLFYITGKYSSGMLAPDDYRGLAISMLKFTGISVVLIIISQILFHIFMSIGMAAVSAVRDNVCDEKEIERNIKIEMTEDERDKLIDLKSVRISFVISGVGFIAALFSIVLNYSPAVMMNIMFLAFFTGSIVEGIAKLVYYRKGNVHA